MIGYCISQNGTTVIIIYNDSVFIASTGVIGEAPNKVYKALILVATRAYITSLVGVQGLSEDGFISLFWYKL